MPTRAVLAALVGAERALTSHELFDRVRALYPASAPATRRALKANLKWLRARQWVAWSPQGKKAPFVIAATDAGRAQPLQGVPAARHLRLARARADVLLASAGLAAAPAGGTGPLF